MKRELITVTMRPVFVPTWKEVITAHVKLGTLEMARKETVQVFYCGASKRLL